MCASEKSSIVVGKGVWREEEIINLGTLISLCENFDIFLGES